MCDDGNRLDGDGCDRFCQMEGKGNHTTTAGEPNSASTVGLDYKILGYAFVILLVGLVL
jgi:hypothetical protein